ncbi:ADP-ribosyltransferase-containing protein [Helicobacter winghamensis]|uniref:ADP-ribosyltransferase-containing protein n=1 Tax=Helicobacter winghamensis TaxID=157268 RepID=UPI00351AF487
MAAGGAFLDSQNLESSPTSTSKTLNSTQTKNTDPFKGEGNKTELNAGEKINQNITLNGGGNTTGALPTPSQTFILSNNGEILGNIDMEKGGTGLGNTLGINLYGDKALMSGNINAKVGQAFIALRGDSKITGNINIGENGFTKFVITNSPSIAGQNHHNNSPEIGTNTISSKITVNKLGMLNIRAENDKAFKFNGSIDNNGGIVNLASYRNRFVGGTYKCGENNNHTCIVNGYTMEMQDGFIFSKTGDYHFKNTNGGKIGLHSWNFTESGRIIIDTDGQDKREENLKNVKFGEFNEFPDHPNYPNFVRPKEEETITEMSGAQSIKTDTKTTPITITLFGDREIFAKGSYVQYLVLTPEEEKDLKDGKISIYDKDGRHNVAGHFIEGGTSLDPDGKESNFATLLHEGKLKLSDGSGGILKPFRVQADGKICYGNDCERDKNNNNGPSSDDIVDNIPGSTIGSNQINALNTNMTQTFNTIKEISTKTFRTEHTNHLSSNTLKEQVAYALYNHSKNVSKNNSLDNNPINKNLSSNNLKNHTNNNLLSYNAKNNSLNDNINLLDNTSNPGNTNIASNVSNINALTNPASNTSENNTLSNASNNTNLEAYITDEQITTYATYAQAGASDALFYDEINKGYTDLDLLRALDDIFIKQNKKESDLYTYAVPYYNYIKDKSLGLGTTKTNSYGLLAGGQLNFIILDSDSKGNFLITAKKVNSTEIENPKYKKLARAGVEPATTTLRNVKQKPTEAISLARDEIIPQNQEKLKQIEAFKKEFNLSEDSFKPLGSISEDGEILTEKGYFKVLKVNEKDGYVIAFESIEQYRGVYYFNKPMIYDLQGRYLGAPYIDGQKVKNATELFTELDEIKPFTIGKNKTIQQALSTIKPKKIFADGYNENLVLVDKVIKTKTRDGKEVNVLKIDGIEKDPITGLGTGDITKADYKTYKEAIQSIILKQKEAPMFKVLEKGINAEFFSDLQKQVAKEILEKVKDKNAVLILQKEHLENKLETLNKNGEWLKQNRPELYNENSFNTSGEKLKQEIAEIEREILQTQQAQNLPPKQAVYLINNTPRNLPIKVESTQKVNANAQNVNTKNVNEKGNIENNVKDVENVESKDLKTLRAQTKEALKPYTQQKITNKGDNTQAVLTHKGISEMLSAKAIAQSVNNGFTKAQHLQAVQNIKDLFESAVFKESQAPKHPKNDVLAYRIYNAPFENANAVISVQERKVNDDVLYFVKLENLQPMQNEASAFTSNLQGLKSKVDNPAERQTLPSLDSEKIIPQQVKTTQEIIKEAKDKNVILKAQNPTKAQIAYFNPFMNEYEKIKEIKKLHTQDDNLIRVMKVDGRNDYIEPLSNMSVSKEYLQKQTAQSLKEQITQAILGNQTQLKALQQGYNTYHLSTFQKEVLESALDIANNPTKYKEYKLQGLQKQLDNLNSNEAYHIEKSREYDRARYAKDRQELEKEISALKGTESSLESVPQKVESSDIVFTDKKGKQHTLTKEVAQQWLETFNLKSLDETYTPQHTQEIKQALGGKEIRLQLGSLKKLVAQGREQYIPQIKEVLDSPEAIMRDDMGEYLFIKHLKDDDYFVNVSFDNGEYLVSISNGIKETRNLNNKIKKGGSFIYQSPNFNSISQKLLQTSQYSANKIDENILPQSKEKIKQEKSREIKRMLKTLKAAGAYDDTEYITSIFPDFFDYFDKANNFYVPKYYTDFKDFIDQVTQLRPLSLFEHSKFPSVKDFESIILNSKNVDFESLKKIQGLKEIVEMLEKEAEIFNSLPQRPKSLKEYFKIKEARNRKTAFKPVTIEKYVKAHFNEPNASESYKEAAKVGIQNAINRAKTKEYKQNLKKWGEGASHYLRDENGDLLLNADGFYYNDKAFFDKHFFKKMYKKRFPAASLASILEEYKAAKSNYENAINTNDFKRFKHDVYFDFMLKKSALNEGSFNPDSKNVLQSNPHLGSGLVGGSVAGIEQDENGNLSFSPEKFALGLLGGVVGSKAVAKGFAYLKENPQVKEAVARELANTLALGFDKAKAKYPALSLLEPRYIVQNEKGRKIQAKSMLKELEKEQKGLYNVAFNGKNAVLIQKDLENIDEAILLQKGTKRKGGKHIRLAHSTDKTQEGYVTKNEVVNLGKDIRQFLKEHKEPFIDTNGARLYEWEKDSARFRVVVNDIQDSGGNSLLPSASEEIITFYSDRNLKEKMEFKNPVLKVQEKFNFNPQKARDLLEWHKDSSPLTKDENGLPKVFYHGSKEKDFEIFERQEKGKFDIGFWFSDNKAFADKYTIDTLSANKGSLYKVFLNMKNPFSMNAPLNESKKAEIHNIFTPTNANKNKAEAELNKWYLAKDELRKNNLELQEYIPEHIIIRDTKNGELFQIGHEHLLRKNRLEDIEDLSGYADSKEFVNKLKAFDNLVGEAKFDNLIKITQDYPNEYFKNDMEFYITRLIDKTELDNNIKGLYEIKPYISTHYAVLRRQPISSILKQKGYDGIVFANDEFVVFDSNQIKHIENKGQNGTYFNDSSPNIYQSNPHLGSGLVGGSVAGIEEDENGNLSFNAEKFALGLLGGVVGSKAVAKGLEWRANKVAKSYPNIAKDNPTLMSEIAKRDLATYARTNAYNTITRFLNNNKILDVNPQLFAGEKALINEAYAPHKARLEKAKELESKGADEIEIWEKTGWYKDKDKKWKFEISQRGGEFDYQSLKKQSDYYKESLPLAEFLHDEKLYQAYPELMDLKILATYDDGRIYKDVKGQYNGDYIFLNTKHLTTDEKAKSILYHELQHAIQDIEGFAYGYKKPIDFRGGFDKYKKQHGEVEARNVEARLNSYGDIHSKQSLKDEIEKLKNTLLSAKKYDPDTAKILADRIEKYEKNYKNLGEYDIYNTRKHPYKTMDTHINDTIAEATMQGEALSKELESSFLDSNGKIDYKALESFAIPLPKPTDIQTFSQNLLNSKNATPNKAKNRVAYKTPAGVVNIYIPYAYRHFGKQGNKKENRFNITGVLIHILDNPTFVTRDEAGTLYFYKPFKNANNIIDIVSISIAKNGKIEYRTTYEATKGRLKQMITRHDLIYMGHKEVAT